MLERRPVRMPFAAVAAISAILCVGFRTDAYAASRAYLYFYTLTGQEIEELETSVSKTRGYEFKDPDEYKYVLEDEYDSYPEWYDEVAGTCWREVDGEGKTIAEYEEGEPFEWSEGDHFFYVRSDDPSKTDEDMYIYGYDQLAHLYFYDQDGEEIEELQANIASLDADDPTDYTFPDPDDYTDEGTGIYWYMETETDDGTAKELYSYGDGTYTFPPGDYYLEVRTDDPVDVSFYYPIEDNGLYWVIDERVGQLYASYTYQVGDKITFLKSLGAIFWEGTFQGWVNYEEDNGEYFTSSSSYTIYDVKDLDFYACYEYDEDWDKLEVDQNTGEPPDQVDAVNIADMESMQAKLGAGVSAYVDANNVLRITGNHTTVGGSDGNASAIEGIPGKIKKQNGLNALKEGGDPDDPADYTKDKYGYDIEESSYDDPNLKEVLAQDDSLMYMDVYGNSFVYHGDMTRENNMRMALERLAEGKTESWTFNIDDGDVDMMDRYEAIEFALIYGTYPGTDEETKEEFETIMQTIGDEMGITGWEGIEWKDEYISKEAYDQIKWTKQIWSGWYDTYDDGLYEKYRNQTASSGVVKTSMLDTIKGTVLALLDGAKGAASSAGAFLCRKFDETMENIMITAQAVQKNVTGAAKQIGARVNISLDSEGIIYTPQYYNPQTRSAGGYYTFDLSLLIDSAAMARMTKIFNALVEGGCSPQFAAGICGNLFEETGGTFDPKSVSSTGSAFGIAQWMGSRKTELDKKAADMESTWDDLDVQIAFILDELTDTQKSSMKSAYANFNSAASDGYMTISNPQIACYVFAMGFERCVVNDSNASSFTDLTENYAIIEGGTRYQHIRSRVNNTLAIYVAMHIPITDADEYGYGPPNNGSSNSVPYFPQSSMNDEEAPWKYVSYGIVGSDGDPAYIYTKGCAVTSLAMVISYHLGYYVYPNDIVEMIESQTGDRNSFYVKDKGSSTSIYSNVASYYGLFCTEVNSKDAITQSLAAGNPVIISVTNTPDEHYTMGAHLIVITGYDAYGNYYVNDPSHFEYSYEIQTLDYIYAHINSGAWALGTK